MTVMDQVWTDNGSANWPPEGWHGLDERDWPRTAEAWVKYDDEAERRRIRDRQQRLRCEHRTWLDHEHFIPGGPSYRYCKAEGVGKAWAREHGMSAHPGEAVSFNYVHARWVYEMMGFADLWDGKPRGWYCVLDGAHPGDRAWEADSLLLGERVADHLRNSLTCDLCWAKFSSQKDLAQHVTMEQMVDWPIDGLGDQPPSTKADVI